MLHHFSTNPLSILPSIQTNLSDAHISYMKGLLSLRGLSKEKIRKSWKTWVAEVQQHRQDMFLALKCYLSVNPASSSIAEFAAILRCDWKHIDAFLSPVRYGHQ